MGTDETAVVYFKAGKNDWWRWADAMNVVEESTGKTTICYREEVEHILAGLVQGGLPSLSFIFHVLFAVNQELKVDREEYLAMKWQKGRDLDTVERSAIHFRENLHKLPEDLRTGDHRIHLIRTLADASGIPLLPPAESKIIVELFVAGELDEDVYEPAAGPNVYRDADDEKAFISLATQYKDVASLEHKLRTGLNQIPLAAQVEIPEEKSKGLLDELEEEEETAFVSRITRRLMAVLNIPMHSKGSSDQPMGGVSDITNRGNYDRLLLSELAQDDLTLMARLANSEALFLRREEPPIHVERQRLLLVDTTLRTWGVQRVFAFSAALACSLQNTGGSPAQAVMLGEETWTEADLNQREGILKALSVLSPGKTPAKALRAVLEGKKQPAGENFLVTTEENAETPELKQALDAVRDKLNFLITVSREGRLQFYTYKGGNRRLLNTGLLDLHAILHEKTRKPVKETERKTIPAFLNWNPMPLLSPFVHVNMYKGRIVYDNQLGVLATTTDGRVLLWKNRTEAAREIECEGVNEALFLGCDSKRYFYIVAIPTTGNSPMLTRIDPTTLQTETVHFQMPPGNWQLVYWAGPAGPFFRMHDALWQMQIGDGGSGMSVNFEKVNPGSGNAFDGILPEGIIKKFCHKGYNVLFNIKQMGWTADGKLSINSRLLVPRAPGEHISITKAGNWTDPVVEIAEKTTQSRVHKNQGILFVRYLWKDGTIGLADSRGFLHLKSSDPALPEITLLLVLDFSTAAWTSDGFVYGNPYFTGSDVTHRKPDADLLNLLKKYHERIISFS